MRKVLVMAALGLVAMPASAQEASGAPGGALAQCMTAKASSADLVVVTRWFTGGLALTPATDGLAKVDAASKEAADRAFAALVERLLTVDCLDAARTTVRHREESGLKVAFSMLIKKAVDHTLDDPAADNALGAYHRYENREAMKALIR